MAARSTPAFQRTALRIGLGAAVTILAANALASRLGIAWKVGGSDSHLLALHFYGRRAEAADAVVIGTSQVRNAFATHVMERVVEEQLGRPSRIWNLGLPGAPPLAAPVIVEKLMSGPRRPRILVMETSPFYFNEARGGQGKEQYWRWFVTPRGALAAARRGEWDGALKSVRRAVWGPEALLRELAFVLPTGSRAGLREAAASRGGMWTEPIYEALDAGTRPRGLRRPREVAEDRIVAQLRPLRSGRHWAHVLEETAALCAERGIELLLVDMPVRADLLRHLAPGEYEAHRRWVREECARLAIACLDLNSDSWRGREGDFRDMLHFGPAGARRFSEHFAREILLPRLH